MKTAYTFGNRVGFISRGVDAQAVGEELESLRLSGPLTPERTVEKAADETTALHGCFEWDDTKAGYEYRLGQSRSLIRAIRVVDAKQEDTRPVFYHVIDRGQARYENAEIVTKYVNLIESAREQLEKELRSAERSLRELEAAVWRSKNPERAEHVARIRKPLAEAVEIAAAPLP